MEVQHRHISAMGTRLDLVFPGLGTDLCDRLMTLIKSELYRLDALLSIYRSDSELSLLNRFGHSGTVALSLELYEIINQVKDLSEKTGGYFDLTVKPVSDFLQSENGQNQTVDQKIRDLIGMDQLIMEDEGIRFRREGVMLDMGGVGKGYAMRRILIILETTGIERALISFGESLIYGMGSHPFGESWKVSVPNKHRQQPIEFDLKDEALSTSGNSLNNQKKFANSGHIVNPFTFQMTTIDGLVSVKAKDPVCAEVCSTALFSAGMNLSDQVLVNVPDVEWAWVHSTV